MFVIIAICQDATFCHLFVSFCQTFDNFLPNSPSSQNLSLSWKSPTINMPLFVISFEYLAKPLMNFWRTHHICRNLPFVNIPLFVTSFEVLPDRGWILAQFPIFSDLPFLWKWPIVNMTVLLSHCVNACQIIRFRKICHFLKAHNYRHASFVILF